MPAAKGGLEIRSLEERVGRQKRQRVAKFLGLDVDEVGESNNSGYGLLDFDIAPCLSRYECTERSAGGSRRLAC